jgi:DNA polymerase-4
VAEVSEEAEVSAVLVAAVLAAAAPEGAGNLNMAEELRKIIHIDMDAFFASVEQRDNPTLKGKPVAVGGSGERSVVAAASYEARRFGVHSAIASSVAKRLCPHLIFVKPRFPVYSAVSRQIRSIMDEYSDLVEPLSLDEAYIDVTYIKKGKPSATLIAREIRQRIRVETGLTASAGVSYNKFLAKMASEFKKPDGMFVILPEEASAFIDDLEIRKFYGIGKVTAKKLSEMGILFGRDLKLVERQELVRLFGKAGNFYYDIVRGIDNRKVEESLERKSIGGEDTFDQDLYLPEQMKPELEAIAERVWQQIAQSGKKGKTVTLKIKYNDFVQHTRSKTMSEEILSKADFLDTGWNLLLAEEPFRTGIRLLGLTLSGFYQPDKGPVQLVLDF